MAMVIPAATADPTVATMTMACAAAVSRRTFFYSLKTLSLALLTPASSSRARMADGRYGRGYGRRGGYGRYDDYCAFSLVAT